MCQDSRLISCSDKCCMILWLLTTLPILSHWCPIFTKQQRFHRSTLKKSKVDIPKVTTEMSRERSQYRRLCADCKQKRKRKKETDKCNPFMYTVQDRNLQTHVYKLVDDKSKMKVVHRNLLLDISFLPVNSCDEDALSTHALRMLCL